MQHASLHGRCLSFLRAELRRRGARQAPLGRNRPLREADCMLISPSLHSLLRPRGPAERAPESCCHDASAPRYEMPIPLSEVPLGFYGRICRDERRPCYFFAELVCRYRKFPSRVSHTYALSASCLMMISIACHASALEMRDWPYFAIYIRCRKRGFIYQPAAEGDESFGATGAAALLYASTPQHASRLTALTRFLALHALHLSLTFSLLV